MKRNPISMGYLDLIPAFFFIWSSLYEEYIGNRKSNENLFYSIGGWSCSVTIYSPLFPIHQKPFIV